MGPAAVIGGQKRLLFVHQNFPGQFKYLAPAFKQRGFDVLALLHHSKPAAAPTAIHGVPVQTWSPKRGTTTQAHPWAHDYETKLIRGQCVAEHADRLRQQGWQPDLIIGHPGWGELLFLKQIWPDVPQLHFLEFFYRASGLDVGFDAEFRPPPAGRTRPACIASRRQRCWAWRRWLRACLLRAFKPAPTPIGARIGFM